MDRKRYRHRRQDDGMLTGAISTLVLMAAWALFQGVTDHSTGEVWGATVRHAFARQLFAAAFCSFFFGGLQWGRIALARKLGLRG